MFTQKITGTPHINEIREVLGGNREVSYNSPYIYVDYTARESAQLDMVKLNVIPGVRASIIQDLELDNLVDN